MREMKVSHYSTYQIGLVQAQAYRMLQQHFRNGLNPYGVTIPEWSLLGIVYDNGQLTLSEITYILKSKASHPTVLVDNLVARGLLSRVVRPQDRRAKIVTLTAEGQRLVPEIEASVRSAIRSAVSQVAREDLEAYYKVLTLFAGNATPQ